MFESLATFYVLTFTALLPALAVAIFAAGALRAQMPLGTAAWTVGGLAVVLGLWLATSVTMAKSGALMPPPNASDPPIALLPLIGGALVFWALVRFSSGGRAVLGGMDQKLLIGFQIPRLMGAVFLLGWAMGDIPWQFALPAGLGDIWAGYAALNAVRALDRGDKNVTALVWRANIIGLLDFVVAVFIGMITSEGFLHLLSQEAPNIINIYPLALFPGYFVPIFIAFHLFSIGALRRARNPQLATG